MIHILCPHFSTTALVFVFLTRIVHPWLQAMKSKSKACPTGTELSPALFQRILQGNIYVSSCRRGIPRALTKSLLLGPNSAPLLVVDLIPPCAPNRGLITHQLGTSGTETSTSQWPPLKSPKHNLSPLSPGGQPGMLCPVSEYLTVNVAPLSLLVFVFMALTAQHHTARALAKKGIVWALCNGLFCGGLALIAYENASACKKAKQAERQRYWENYGNLGRFGRL
ncbi:hypothetical protein B0T14DRAFT_276413 [Immersiella caudata]|uniref:Uncharacterized protein n=1 Tax=Immersiella caudata TaxID=314043 RepID=A0AA39WDC7_9PEZI|nr:hypothetical protein B0T14DRAFT_276413 [Immersiella caudata]